MPALPAEEVAPELRQLVVERLAVLVLRAQVRQVVDTRNPAHEHDVLSYTALQPQRWQVDVPHVPGTDPRRNGPACVVIRRARGMMLRPGVMVRVPVNWL